jgi:G2/mitotic-specific cyclin 1/2
MSNQSDAIAKGVKTRATLRQKPAAQAVKKSQPVQPALNTRTRSQTSSIPAPVATEAPQEVSDSRGTFEAVEVENLQKETSQPTSDHVIPKAALESKPLEVTKAIQEWEDLDANDHDDPMMVSEYVVEIYEYMRKLEVDIFSNRN